MNGVNVGFFVLCVSLATSVQGMAQAPCTRADLQSAVNSYIAAFGAFSQIH